MCFNKPVAHAGVQKMRLRVFKNLQKPTELADWELPGLSLTPSPLVVAAIECDAPPPQLVAGDMLPSLGSVAGQTDVGKHVFLQTKTKDTKQTGGIAETQTCVPWMAHTLPFMGSVLWEIIKRDVLNKHNKLTRKNVIISLFSRFKHLLFCCWLSHVTGTYRSMD